MDHTNGATPLRKSYQLLPRQPRGTVSWRSRKPRYLDSEEKSAGKHGRNLDLAVAAGVPAQSCAAGHEAHANAHDYCNDIACCVSGHLEKLGGNNHQLKRGTKNEGAQKTFQWLYDERKEKPNARAKPDSWKIQRGARRAKGQRGVLGHRCGHTRMLRRRAAASSLTLKVLDLLAETAGASCFRGNPCFFFFQVPCRRKVDNASSLHPRLLPPQAAR